MHNLIINYATRGREKLFLASLKNITETIGLTDYRILVSADLDDFVMNSDAMRNKISQFHNTEIYYNEPTSKVGAINATVKHFGDFYWLINHSDDFLYVHQDWGVKMLRRIKNTWGDNTDFSAHFNDNYTYDKLCTMHIVGKSYFDRDGYVYNNAYGSICCDCEAYFVAQMRGRYNYFPEIFFHHVHPSNLGFAADETYRRNDAHGENDVKVYFERMKILFGVENPIMIPEVLRKEMIEKGFKIPNNL